MVICFSAFLKIGNIFEKVLSGNKIIYFQPIVSNYVSLLSQNGQNIYFSKHPFLFRHIQNGQLSYSKLSFRLLSGDATTELMSVFVMISLGCFYEVEYERS